MPTYTVRMTDHSDDGPVTTKTVSIEADGDRVAYWKALALHGSDNAEIVSVHREGRGGEEYVSAAETARQLHIDKATAGRWATAGRLKGAYRTAGGHWRIPTSEVERLRGQ